jgi:quercetin dioxygenase-like cupin family protein
MANQLPSWRFVSFKEAELEPMPNHMRHWYSKPGMVADTNLLFVRAHFPSGAAHKFHHHPNMEEIIYIISGTAEEWVEKEMRVVGPGDSIYIPAGTVHATFNTGSETLEFLAVLTPAKSAAPDTVDMSDQEPWKSMRPWPN